MNKRRINMKILIFALLGIAVIGVGFGKIYLLSTENKAIELAQNYLANKYEQKMQYSSVRYSWIDPSLYHVTFSPAENPKLFFEVLVQNNLTIQEDHQNSDQNKWYSADNYYIKNFEYQMEEYLSPEVKRLWGNDAKITVLQMNSSIYSFSVTHKLDNTMPLSEMDKAIDNYWIFVSTSGAKLDGQSLVEMANLTFEFIQRINQEGFAPEVIEFQYLNKEGGTIEIELHDSNKIDGVAQIMKILKAEIELEQK